MLVTLSAPAMAADTSEEVGTRIGYAEYELSDLIGADSIMPRASATKEKALGKISAYKSGGQTGAIFAACAPFTFTGIPSTAKISNIQAWNPLKSNISQGGLTAIENFKVYCKGEPSALFKFQTIASPTTQYSCSTSSLNGRSANAPYYVEIHGTVMQNLTGVDGFTVAGAKLRVTYTY